MNIETIIPPEIFEDDFAKTLEILCTNVVNLNSILEIGSSSGGGSTQAMVKGVISRNNSDSVKMICLEVSKPRFLELANRYSQYNFLIPLNISSASDFELATEAEVSFFYQNIKTNLNNYPLTQVLDWLKQDLSYLRSNAVNANGVKLAKAIYRITNFDLVLIDGSEFSGQSDLLNVMGARYIALDDVNSFKCFTAYKMLAAHHYYKLIAQNLNLRNGYAIFGRAD
jgi:hypothetical protein